MPSLSKIESIVTIVLLVILLGFSIVSAFLSIDAKWFVPALFLALLLIVRIVWPLSSVRGDIVALQASVDRLVSGNELAGVQLYTSGESFYRDAESRVREATDHVYLTYLRRTPPDETGSTVAQAYFATVLRWAQVDTTHTVRRIIGRQPNHPAFERWLEKQLEHARNIPSYSIRTLDWPVGADAINMALIDSEFVFLLIAGDQPNKLRGLSINSPAASTYLHDYYAGLWECGHDVEAASIHSR